MRNIYDYTLEELLQIFIILLKTNNLEITHNAKEKVKE